MHAGGGDTEDNVAGRDIRSRQQPVALDRADREAGEIIVFRRVHARHFGSLAADQRTAGLAAALGDALDDFRGPRRIELAGGEIIEEEQRLRALHHQIVDAHGDQIDADRVVPVGADRELEFGADAVGGGHQQGIAEIRALEVEHAAEAADLAVGARSRGRAREWLDQIDQPIAGIDIDSCVAVAQPLGLRHVSPPRGGNPNRKGAQGKLRGGSCSPLGMKAAAVYVRKLRTQGGPA